MLNYFYKKFDNKEKKYINFVENLKNNKSQRSHLLKKVILIIEETLNLKLRVLQIAAAEAMLDGYISNIDTGEGKSLVICIVAAVQALEGKKVYIATPNDSLAEFGYIEHDKIYDNLDLLCDYISEEDNIDIKKIKYNSNIIYANIKELVFDKLKTDRFITPNQRCQRINDSIILDEIDLTLIDNLKNPFILSEDSEVNYTDIYTLLNICKKLIENVDYIIHKDYVELLEKGFDKIEKSFGINSWNLVNECLYALFLLHKNINYIVSENSKGRYICLIDQTTGEKRETAKFNKNIHAFIEAKEKIMINKKMTIKDEMSINNYISLFNSFTGTSATANYCAQEISELYNKSVITFSRFTENKNLDHGYKQKKNIDLIKYIFDQRKNHSGPFLIVTKDILEAEKVFKQLKNMKNVDKLTGKNSIEITNLLEKLSKNNGLLITTQIGGRGLDIRPTHPDGLFVISLTANKEKRNDIQIKGRAGRNGKKGQYICFTELSHKNIITMQKRETYKNKEDRDNYYHLSQLKFKGRTILNEQLFKKYKQHSKIEQAIVRKAINELISIYFKEFEVLYRNIYTNSIANIDGYSIFVKDVNNLVLRLIQNLDNEIQNTSRRVYINR